MAYTKVYHHLTGALITDEHRSRLIEKIKSIEDKDIIDEIYGVLEVDFVDTFYVTNEKQKAEIAEARKQIKGIDSAEVLKKARQWVEK